MPGSTFDLRAVPPTSPSRSARRCSRSRSGVGLEDAAVEQHRRRAATACLRLLASEHLGVAGSGTAARCRVMAGSAAYGRPSSCKPAARAAAGSASRVARAGRSRRPGPSRRRSRVSSRLDRAADDLAAAAEDRDRRGWPASGWRTAVSLAPRQACQSACIWPGVELRALGGQRLAATWCASVRSMLSPPSRMWSPTASRVSARLPSSSPTAISVKSVVPPPTSQTRMTSPTLTCLRQSSPVRLEPGVERGLRLFQQRDVFEPRGAWRPRRSARGPRRRTRPAPSGRCPASSSRWSATSLAIDLVPRLGQVLQVAGAGLDRRDLAAILRRLPRQDRRAAIDAGMAQPRLGRRRQPRRHLAAEVAGELADGVSRAPCPRAASGCPWAARSGPGR